MKTASEKLSAIAKPLTLIGKLIFHQLFSTIGVVILSAQLIFALFALGHTAAPTLTPQLASYVLTQIPGFPVQATIALLLGFAFAKLSWSRILEWMWVLPLALFCWTLVDPPLNGSAFFGPFYFSGPRHTLTLLDRLSYALPLVASASYSLGAWIAHRTWRSRQRIQKQNAAITEAGGSIWNSSE